MEPTDRAVIAALEKTVEDLKAKIKALEPQPAPPEPPPVKGNPHAMGVIAGRCSLCDCFHPPGQHSHCPACRRQYGSLYASANPNDPVCATCGSKPWLGPSYKSGGAIPQEIGRNMTARGATADPYYEQRAQAMAAELAKKGNGNG